MHGCRAGARSWSRARTCVALSLALCATGGRTTDRETMRFATELATIGDHEGAAIEYRRLALGDAPAEERAVWLWAAAREHWRAGQFRAAMHALDRAEPLGLPSLPLRVMRAEVANSLHDFGAAEFYWRSIADDPDVPNSARAVAARRSAALCLRDRRFDDAVRSLSSSPLDEARHVQRIEQAASQPRRQPWIGGLLGLIPGLGYCYSGEYANGARSFLLNGLFLGLMVWAIDQEQWAAAGVIGFFEITWYSGSIYGGVDAAHRWNRRILEEAASALEQEAQWSVEDHSLPLVRLRFEL